jgi:hypothetical protein
VPGVTKKKRKSYGGGDEHRRQMEFRQLPENEEYAGSYHEGTNETVKALKEIIGPEFFSNANLRMIYNYLKAHAAEEGIAGAFTSLGHDPGRAQWAIVRFLHPFLDLIARLHNRESPPWQLVQRLRGPVQPRGQGLGRGHKANAPAQPSGPAASLDNVVDGNQWGWYADPFIEEV